MGLGVGAGFVGASVAVGMAAGAAVAGAALGLQAESIKEGINSRLTSVKSLRAIRQFPFFE